MNPTFWKDRNVLITGHTGFKGSWLTMFLNNFQANLYGYALSPASDNCLYEICNLDKHIKSIIADIRSIDELKKTMQLAQPEVVFHLAAQPLVIDSYIDPVHTYGVNVMGTVNLLEAVRQCSSVKSVVVITTDKCYENKEWPWGYRETDQLGGYDPYSSSKSCTELVVNAYRSSFYNKLGIRVATARAGNVIGGGDVSPNRLIPDLYSTQYHSMPLIVRNPQSVRPWQHVLEPLHGYLLLAEKLFYDEQFSGAWNFGPNSDGFKSVQWIIDEVSNYWPKVKDYTIEPSDMKETNILKLDYSKARELMGWEPRLSFKNTLIKTIEWYDNLKYGNNEIYQKSIVQINDYLSECIL